MQGAIPGHNPAEALAVAEQPAPVTIIHDRAGAALGNRFGAARGGNCYLLLVHASSLI